jgi:hypothetical protein
MDGGIVSDQGGDGFLGWALAGVAVLGAGAAAVYALSRVDDLDDRFAPLGDEVRLDALRAASTSRAAASYVDVVLRGDCSGRKCPTVRGRAKVDTGARSTFISPKAARKLGLERRGTENVRGLGGDGRRVGKYGVRVGIAGRQVDLLDRGAPSYPSLDRRGDVALVGREALADAGLQLVYDAPSGRATVRPSATKRRKK